MMFSAVLAWAINASVMKVGLRYLDPASFTAARFVIAAVASWSLSIAIHRRRGFQPPPARVPTVAVLGLGLNGLFFAFGLNLTTAVAASLIQGLTPVLTGALVMLVMHRRMPFWEAFTLALGFGGVAAVVLAAPTHGGGNAVGDAIILGAPLTWAFFLVFTSGDAARLPATRIAPWILTAPLVLLIPAAAAEAVHSSEDWVAAIPALLVAGLGATAFAYTASLWSLPRLGVTATAIYSYFQPPVGAAIGAIFLGEAYGPLQLGGTLMILFAAVLSSRSAAVSGQGRSVRGA
jgi:drug/metabolite transporter (DMT)-like permease